MAGFEYWGLLPLLLLLWLLLWFDDEDAKGWQRLSSLRGELQRNKEKNVLEF